MLSVNGAGAGIDAEARRWLLLMDPGPPTPAQRAAFETWLRANPEHPLAYEEARRVWQGIGQLSHLGAYLRKEDLERFRQESPAHRVGTRDHRSPTRSRFLRPHAIAAVTLVAALCIGLASLFGPGEEFTTPVGKIDRLNLPDGSEVVLGARSDITVKFTSKERRVTLLTGEAFFNVARDAERPFLVAVDNQIVRAVGTQFEVHRDEQKIRVAVVEGVVEVSGAPEAESAAGEARPLTARKTVLAAGQQFVANRVSGRAEPVRFISTQATATWRSGRLFYEDATVGEVVDDISRYYPHSIEIQSDEVRAMRITGSFKLDRIEELFDNFERVLPIRVDRREDRSIVLDRKP